jgi:hypothetical protein
MSASFSARDQRSICRSRASAASREARHCDEPDPSSGGRRERQPNIPDSAAMRLAYRAAHQPAGVPDLGTHRDPGRIRARHSILTTWLRTATIAVSKSTSAAVEESTSAQQQYDDNDDEESGRIHCAGIISRRSAPVCAVVSSPCSAPAQGKTGNFLDRDPGVVAGPARVRRGRARRASLGTSLRADAVRSGRGPARHGRSDRGHRHRARRHALHHRS